ncbi:MAG: hypothetical protein AAF645_02945 [Myxococcota bacterium]
MLAAHEGSLAIRVEASASAGDIEGWLDAGALVFDAPRELAPGIEVSRLYPRRTQFVSVQGSQLRVRFPSDATPEPYETSFACGDLRLQGDLTARVDRRPLRRPRIRLHSRPNARRPRRMTLDEHTRIVVLEEQGRWARVRVPYQGLWFLGWVRASAIGAPSAEESSAGFGVGVGGDRWRCPSMDLHAIRDESAQPPEYVRIGRVHPVAMSPYGFEGDVRTGVSWFFLGGIVSLPIDESVRCERRPRRATGFGWSGSGMGTGVRTGMGTGTAR